MGTHAPIIHAIYFTIFIGDVNHMKNKLDWFDDNRNWDVWPSRVLYELLLSLTYRLSMRVKEVYSFKCGAKFPRCPRCGTTMEREYQRFYDFSGIHGSRFNFATPKRFISCSLRITCSKSFEDFCM